MYELDCPGLKQDRVTTYCGVPSEPLGFTTGILLGAYYMSNSEEVPDRGLISSLGPITQSVILTYLNFIYF